MTFLGLLGWGGSILAVPILTYAVDFGAKKEILRGLGEGGTLHAGRGERGAAMGMRGVLVSILWKVGVGIPPFASRVVWRRAGPDRKGRTG